MRFLTALLFLFLSGALVQAQTDATIVDMTQATHIEPIFASGNSSGYCSGDNYFCIDPIKQNAQRDALQQATWTCQARNGIANTFSSSCSGYCSPTYIPPGQSQFVSCHSDCSVQCEIPNHNTEITE